jgi:hypothetical protein
MHQKTACIRDNFLSSGTTEIWDERGQAIGRLDLHSMFNPGASASGRLLLIFRRMTPARLTFADLPLR